MRRGRLGPETRASLEWSVACVPDLTSAGGAFVMHQVRSFAGLLAFTPVYISLRMMHAAI